MLNGVFGTMSSTGASVAGTAATRYSADMKPQTITETQVPTAPVGNRRGSVGQHSEVIGESIFGNFLYSSDQVPQRTNPSWKGGAPGAPEELSGFGDALVPTTELVPATDHWGGYGIFGGRGHRGGYGMNRYGQPIHGLGLTDTQKNTAYAVAGVAALAAIGGGIWWWSKKKKKAA